MPSKRLTSPSPPLHKTKAIPRNPLTTIGKKIRDAQMASKALQNIPREKPEPKHPPKARSFACPDEADQDERLKAEADAVKKIQPRKRKTNPKPITTKQKIARAEMIKNAKGGAKRAPIPTEPRVPFPGNKNLMQYHHEAACVPMILIPEKDRVTFRPTERALRYRRSKGNTYRPPHRVPAGGKSLMDLDKATRARIYRLVVADQKCCIWPGSCIGDEQPDLAMTCRTIRKEVLPLYYAENTFAVNLSPQNMEPLIKKPFLLDASGRRTKTKPLSGIAAVHKWAKVLEEAGWIRYIKNWAFDHPDPNPVLFGREERDDASALVFVGFQGAGVRKVKVQIHREAACILPGWADCGSCTLQKTPEEVASAIVSILVEKSPMAETITKVAKKLREMPGKLQVARCEKA